MGQYTDILIYSMDLLKLIDSLFAILFPPRCLICRKTGDEALCPNCISKIKRIPCQNDEARSVGVYEGVLRTAIKKLKFKSKKKLARPLAFLLVEYLNNWAPSETIDYIVSVPLSKKRLRSRGFNQVDLLADVVSGELNIPFASDLLLRTKETKPQFELKREERFKNLKGAFEVSNTGNVKGKNILLLDDILTTGSTVSECAKVLKEAGASKICVLTLARAIE